MWRAAPIWNGDRDRSTIDRLSRGVIGDLLRGGWKGYISAGDFLIDEVPDEAHIAHHMELVRWGGGSYACGALNY